MSAILRLLARSLRHAVAGVAVVAVLMTAFGVHLHAEPAHDHGVACDHAPSLALGQLADDAGLPSDETDPDGCGTCHCPAVAVLLPDAPVLTQHPSLSVRLHLVQAAGVPDSLSYPPDPPPIRLG